MRQEERQMQNGHGHRPDLHWPVPLDTSQQHPALHSPTEKYIQKYKHIYKLFTLHTLIYNIFTKYLKLYTNIYNIFTLNYIFTHLQNTLFLAYPLAKCTAHHPSHHPLSTCILRHQHNCCRKRSHTEKKQRYCVLVTLFCNIHNTLHTYTHTYNTLHNIT